MSWPPESLVDAFAEKRPPRRALLLVPFPDMKAVAAMCCLMKVDALVLPSDTGVLLCLDRTDPEDVDEAATTFAAMSGDAPVLAIRQGPTDDPSVSDIQAWEYHDLDKTALPNPGLVAANMPPVVEDVLVGAVDPWDVEGLIDPTSMSFLEAHVMLDEATTRVRERERLEDLGLNHPDDAAPNHQIASPPKPPPDPFAQTDRADGQT